MSNENFNVSNPELFNVLGKEVPGKHYRDKLWIATLKFSLHKSYQH